MKLFFFIRRGKELLGRVTVEAPGDETKRDSPTRRLFAFRILTIEASAWLLFVSSPEISTKIAGSIRTSPSHENPVIAGQFQSPSLRFVKSAYLAKLAATSRRDRKNAEANLKSVVTVRL